jgi:autotransporter-associated beta strand protein
VPITIASGATLDVNGIVGTNSATVSGAGVLGNGAIVNNSSGALANPALAFITLAGNTTIGGTNRWDLRPAASLPDTASATLVGLSTGGQPYNLTKMGPNLISIISATVDTNLANIIVQSGTLNFEGNTTGLGNPAATLTVFTNATLEFLSLANSVNKIVMFNDGGTFFNAVGVNTLNGYVVLGTNTPNGVANCTFNVGGTSLLLSGIVSGPGNLIKIGNTILYLAAANTYKGTTFIKAGTLTLTGTGSISASTNIIVTLGATLSVSNRTDGTLTLASGQKLFGSGTVLGKVVVAAGSTLSVGTNAPAISQLTISSNLTLQGTAAMKLNPATSASDLVRASAVAYGGTLMLTNVSAAPLAAGNSFQLFSAGTYSGAFSALNPAIPAPGLRWSTGSLTANGTLSVVAIARPGIASFVFSGSNLLISATNGVAGATYNLLMSTNLALPLSQWSPVATNALVSAGNFVITASNTFGTGAAQQFYVLQAQ